MDPEAFRLPRGKWIRLEQEIVLNTPGRKDGSIRVWVDGTLVVDKQHLMLRDNDAVDVCRRAGRHALRRRGFVVLRTKDAKIRLTPFEVRMR